MKIKPIVFSISGAIIISLFFTLSLFWIFYEYSGSQNSTKDAISTLSGYFGGIATLWAAIIAAYLFNDWRVVKQYEVILNYVLIIKKQIQELITFINTNRKNFIKYKSRIKDPHLKLEEFRLLQLEIAELEGEIIARLNFICLEMNELYFLKTQKPQDPITTALIEKIKYFTEIGVNQKNYFDVWEERLTTTVLDEYFHYITDDLTGFVYDEVMTQYLDDLILDVN